MTITENQDLRQQVAVLLEMLESVQEQIVDSQWRDAVMLCESAQRELGNLKVKLVLAQRG